MGPLGCGFGWLQSGWLGPVWLGWGLAGWLGRGLAGWLGLAGRSLASWGQEGALEIALQSL